MTQKSNTQQTSTQITIPAIADDGSLYPLEKMEAHRLGALHLAISVFLFSQDNRLLIQRRADEKYHCGGLWANTCCSHPNWGENIDDCANRRMDDELGITVALTKIGVVEYRADVGPELIEHERVHMFSANADRHALELRPNPAEVAQTKWVTLPQLRADMSENPSLYTPWFCLYMERWSELWVPAA